jgi:glutaredoxin 3
MEALALEYPLGMERYELGEGSVGEGTNGTLDLGVYSGAFMSAAQPLIEIYTWRSCPFCIRAKALLDHKKVTYTEYAIDGDEAARDKMSKRAMGRRSVPQIFINDQHVGGCDDIQALDRAGKLDPLLKAV